jgi:hypothetical protein
MTETTPKLSSVSSASRASLRRHCMPHLHRDWAHPCHICTGTGLRLCHMPHLHRDRTHRGWESAAKAGGRACAKLRRNGLKSFRLQRKGPPVCVRHSFLLHAVDTGECGECGAGNSCNCRRAIEGSR